MQYFSGESSGSAKTVTIVVVVILSLSACVLLIMTFRSNKGLLTIVALRGNLRQDAEVRFLTRDNDDDDS